MIPDYDAIAKAIQGNCEDCNTCDECAIKELSSRHANFCYGYNTDGSPHKKRYMLEHYRKLFPSLEIPKIAESDQSIKADAGKLRLTLVPTKVIEDIAEVRMYAHTKYGDGADHWDEVEIERYRDALFRHFLAYLKDPHGKDAESGIEHYKHMACNMAFLCEMEGK